MPTAGAGCEVATLGRPCCSGTGEVPLVAICASPTCGAAVCLLVELTAGGFVVELTAGGFAVELTAGGFAGSCNTVVSTGRVDHCARVVRGLL